MGKIKIKIPKLNMPKIKIPEGILLPSIERTVARNLCDKLKNDSRITEEAFNTMIENIRTNPHNKQKDNDKQADALEEHRSHFKNLR